MIRKGECDIAVLINTLAYIDHQQAYLTKLHNAMLPGDTLMVVDLNRPAFQASPALQNNRSRESIEILKAAGFTDAEVDTNT